MSCDCESYNLGGGDIDACIVEAIRHLWARGIETLSCCCGHGKTNPSIVVGDGYDDAKILEILLELSQVDDRDWDIFQWKLMQVG